MPSPKHIQITVKGRVQGVGFRPTVYRYATQLGLLGTVRNDTSGVVIDLQGPSQGLNAFIELLETAPPPHAIIEKITLDRNPPAITPANDFRILPSSRSGDLAAGMPPDLATCDQCRDEMSAPRNRRYRYPFLNCTDCGPRFTIIAALPYDRVRTSMAAFQLCPECLAEYHSPADRRFEAQPNACSVCGPKLRLLAPSEDTLAHAEQALREAIRRLRAGEILAIKGLGGFHLACRADQDETIARLRSRKNRPHKAFAVMFASLEEANQYCYFDNHEKAALASPARPIVIVKPRPDKLSAMISPDTDDVGALLPYTPLHHLLLAEVSPLIMTSANFAEEPIRCDSTELNMLLGGIADAALDHDRGILRRCDDSVLKIVAGKPLFYRRSRGFVPAGIRIPTTGPSVLACGAELKNTFCVTRRDQAFISQHIGDLTEYRAFSFFQESVTDLCRLLEVTPDIVAHDLHPDYLSTVYAQQLPGKYLIPVQHHHAHIASCMAENGLSTPVIGIALDGTGYGPDGTIWGGEFLVCDLHRFERVAHFKQYPMPGGNAAVDDPRRMAYGILFHEGLISAPGSEPTPANLDLVNSLGTQCRDMLWQMLERKLNCPGTSSAGRLFDAVAAIIGICTEPVTYEGQAAVRLQFIANHEVTEAYPVKLIDNILDWGPMIQCLSEEKQRGVSPAIMAAKFHNTIAQALLEVVENIRSTTGLTQVALSGGVFQNERLLHLTLTALRSHDFNVYQHHQVPPNDGGIALGQAAIALANTATAF